MAGPSPVPASSAASRATRSHMSSGSGAGSLAMPTSKGCHVWRATPMMQVARGSVAALMVREATRAGSAARLAGHGDGPVGDDVLLDLGGAPADGRVALEG